MARSTSRFVGQVRGILAERRNIYRLHCDIAMYDRHGRPHQIVDVGLDGVRYLSPQAPVDEAQLFTIPLPNSEFVLRLAVRKVWARRRDPVGFEVGARVDGRGPHRRRWHFLVNSLKENREYTELRWVPLELLDEPLDPPDLIEEIARRRLEGPAATATRRVGVMFGRPRFYWQWADHVIRDFTFSSVHPAWYERAVELKLCASIFFTAVDDIADELQDRQLFRQLLARVQGHRLTDGDQPTSEERRRQLRHLEALWRYLLHAVRRLPRYREVADCLRFDTATILHSMAHALVVNHSPTAISEAEQQFWGIHAAYLLLFADLDLMCSPAIDLREFGVLRELALEAQQMCAIANWIGTWEREVRSGDYSSAVIGAAIQRGIVSPEQLGTTTSERLIRSIRDTDIETALMARWEKHWASIDRRRSLVHSVDVGAYLAGLEGFFRLHLAARQRLEQPDVPAEVVAAAPP